jgi:hypothetical protein
VAMLGFGRSVLCVGLAGAVLAGCGSSDGTQTISSSVIGSLPCYPNVDHWYDALAYKKNFGEYPPSDQDNDVGTALLPGDKVKVLESHLVDEQPGLVDVTGEVFKVQALSGTASGKACWIFSGSNSNGPLFE